jgi:hypothetical protein
VVEPGICGENDTVHALGPIQYWWKNLNTYTFTRQHPFPKRIVFSGNLPGGRDF